MSRLLPKLSSLLFNLITLPVQVSPSKEIMYKVCVDIALFMNLLKTKMEFS